MPTGRIYILRFVCFLLVLPSLALSYSVGLLERNLGTSPNWKIAKHNTLYTDISHRFFTPWDQNGDYSPIYQDLLGVDGGANLGLSISYGWGNLTDFTLSRYSVGKQYNFANRWKVMDQYVDRLPLSLSAEWNYGRRTDEFVDHKNTYGYHLLVSKYWWQENLALSLIWAGQNGISSNLEDVPYDAQWTHSIGGTIALRWSRYTLSGEYHRPITGYLREDFNQEIHDIFGFNFAYKTYQHVFSIGIQNHVYNHFGQAIAGANHDPNSESNIRFGFNITRELDFLNHAPDKRSQDKD